jgi:ring-1,2-phenylacetyl-CoA epoxidase subunit PaaD
MQNYDIQSADIQSADLVTASEHRAWTAAAAVVDPELPMLTLADLGVLREVTVDGERVRVALAPTYTGCPAMAEMRADVTARLHAAGFAEVEVAVALDPPWRSSDITERGRELLADHGIAPPGEPRTGLIQLGVRLEAPACPQCGSAETEVASPFGATPCTALCRCRSCAEPFSQVKAR